MSIVVAKRFLKKIKRDGKLPSLKYYESFLLCEKCCEPEWFRVQFPKWQTLSVDHLFWFSMKTNAKLLSEFVFYDNNMIITLIIIIIILEDNISGLWDELDKEKNKKVTVYVYWKILMNVWILKWTRIIF